METQQYYHKHPGLPAECRLNQTKEGKKDRKPLKRASALVLRAGSCGLAVYQEQVWWSLVGSSHRTIKGRLRCDNQERKEEKTTVCKKRATAENSTALKNSAGSHLHRLSVTPHLPPLTAKLIKGGLQYDRFLSYSASLGREVAPKPVCLYKKIARVRSYN